MYAWFYKWQSEGKVGRPAAGLRIANVFSFIVLITLWTAAVTKIIYIEEFWAALENVPMLPNAVLVPISGVIIGLELFLPVGLFFTALRQATATCLTILFGGFFIYALYRVWTNSVQPCGCFHGVLRLASLQDAILICMLGAMCFQIENSCRKVSLRDSSQQAFRYLRSMMSVESLVAFLSIVIAVGVIAYRLPDRNKNLTPVQGVRSQDLISEDSEFEGDPSSPLTIVMFMDYQCGPCKEVHENLSRVVRQHFRKLRVCYRHYPLSSIHPNAFEAAIAVEGARSVGRYWELHERLLRADLSRVSIIEVASSLKLDASHLEKVGRNAVQRDMKLGERLGVRATPTLFLCRKDGSVFLIRDSMDVEPLL